jgi:transposase-like protein
MGESVRPLTPEWITIADVARLRGVSRQAALSWLRRREREDGRQYLIAKPCQFGKKLMLRMVDLSMLVHDASKNRPMLPEVLQLREELDALEISHNRLMAKVAELEKALKVTKTDNFTHPTT